MRQGLTGQHDIYTRIIRGSRHSWITRCRLKIIRKLDRRESKTKHKTVETISYQNKTGSENARNKLPKNTGSLISCLLCVDATLVHPFIHRSVLNGLKSCGQSCGNGQIQGTESEHFINP